MTKITVGWQEYLTLPDLGIPSIAVKVDTGAKTSALHVQDITPSADSKTVQFRICLRRRDKPNGLPAHFEKQAIAVESKKAPTPPSPEDLVALSPIIEAPLIDYRTITSSNGDPENRHVIATTIQLGKHQWKTEITLTARTSMGFGMLLGRRAMESRIIVDPGASYLWPLPTSTSSPPTIAPQSLG